MKNIPVTDTDILKITVPDKGIPLIFDSPHSGRSYPADFHFSCPFDVLQGAEDNYVDDLFSSAPAYGAALLCALFPRTYIDVNRAQDDIDPELLTEPWPHPPRPGARSHAGIGLIRRIVRPGITVYDRTLGLKEIKYRIEKYYEPYHKTLASLIGDAHYRFGQSWHINCHSMPSASAAAATTQIQSLPDFVLGDRDRTTCDPVFTFALRDFLRTLGYKVALNHPYKGVELVRRHSYPRRGRHSLQIEINKALYWNEKENKKSKDYNLLKADIEKMISFCADYVSQGLVNLAAD